MFVFIQKQYPESLAFFFPIIIITIIIITIIIIIMIISPRPGNNGLMSSGG